jgi:hypothetical protein
MHLILSKLQREGIAPLRYVLRACMFIETEYRRISLAICNSMRLIARHVVICVAL